MNTRQSGNLLISNCPIHHGDNLTAFNVNFVNGEYAGRWFCNTAGCHKEYGGDVIGLIRGLMSLDGPTSFKDVINYAATFAGMDRFDFVPDNLDDIFLNDHEEIIQVSRKEWRQNLKIPKHYLDRGFSYEVLDFFDVKLCTDPESEMYQRAMFPIYNNTWEHVVGIVGRAIVNDIPRWRNQTGFNKSEYLYAYWSALPHICKTGKAILVEGQGDVMRLWEAGIYNAVGIIGSDLSETQELLLQTTGAMHIITCFDNDDSGSKCRSSCDRRLRRLFNLKHVIPIGNDVGDMEPNKIIDLHLNC